MRTTRVSYSPTTQMEVHLILIVVLYTVISQNFVIVEGISTTESGRSLFDALPLSGAFSSREETQDISSTEKISFSSSSKIFKKKLHVETNGQDVNSLFDILPNQGAMTAEHIFDSKTQKRGILDTHPNYLRGPNGELRFQIELEKAAPLAEFKLDEFHPNQIPDLIQRTVSPTVHSLNFVPRNPATLIPQTYGGSYKTPVQPTIRRNYPYVSTASSTPIVRRPTPSTMIIYGSPIPNLGKTTTQAPTEVHHYYYPPQTRTRNHKAQKVTNPINQLPIPIVTGPMNDGYGPETGNQNIDITTSTPPVQITTQRPTNPPFPSGFGDYDYETLSDTRRSEGQFDSRTGYVRFDEPSPSYQIPDVNSKSYYNARQPSHTYGPPQPSSTYGPPPPVTNPPPSYGPPRVPEEIPPPQPTTSTSISYQTIPIQTIQTQLVTVPQITVSSSSGIQSDPDASRPQSPGRPLEPPSSSYGVPTMSPERSTRSGNLFTEDQVALLLAASGGSQLDEPNDDELLGIGSAGTRTGIGNLLNRNAEALLSSSILGDSRARFRSSTQQLRNFGGLPFQEQNLLPLLLQQQRFAGGLVRNVDSSNLGFVDGLRSPNGAVIVPDALGDIGGVLREQQLQSALSNIRGRLRHVEGRNFGRTRQYRSLLYKAALLLGALTLIPNVATPFAQAAATSSISAPHFLLPISAGRKKRSLEITEHDAKIQIADSFILCQNILSPETNANSTGRIINYLTCVSRNNKTNDLDGPSLFDDLPFSGALIPQEIKADLHKYVSVEEISKNSECIQKQFCQTYLEIEESPEAAQTIARLYAMFSTDIETNPLIKASVTAARNRNCEAFYCADDYKNTISSTH